ncbi:MAG: hypothetical protein PWP23_1876 [Candidatus Sumerlaeota bacterium]|nr:hypothetical protein [Candidatus Sumerlaeota bacterium]
MMRRCLLLVCLLLAFVAKALAQGAVRAYLDAERISPGDTFNYVLEANREIEIGRYGEPAVQGDAAEFIRGRLQRRVLSTSQGGRAPTATYQYFFAMRALKDGAFSIPSLKVEVGGQVVVVPAVNGVVQPIASFDRSSLPGEIGVPNLPDAGRVRALSESFFTTLEVSDDEPFPGEPIEAITYIYSSVNGELSASPVSEPETPRFVRVPEGDAAFSPRQERVTVDGRIFRRVACHRMILVPTQSGETTLEGAEVGVGRSMGGFFGRTVIDFTLTQPTQKLTVRPLPAEPDGVVAQFVGNFTIGVTTDRQEVSEGDLVTIEVYVSGDGYLETAGLGSLPEMKGLSFVSDEVRYDAGIVNGRLVSKKSFKFVYQAVEPGTIEVPALSFALVHPDTGEQTIRKTEPITITVKPSAKSSLQLTSAAPETERGKARELSREGILYIDESPLSERTLAETRVPLVRRPVYWLAHGVALLLAALYGGFLVWQRRQASDAGRVRARAARQRGSEALREARRLAAQDDGSAYYAALAAGVTNHVSSFLGREASGLTVEEACDALNDCGLAEESARLRELLAHFDAKRFAPAEAGGDRQADLQAAEDFVQRLSRAPRRRN